MTERDDHSNDMAEQPQLSDALVDALLAGEPAGGDGDTAAVARFLDGMRAAASETPAPPSAALASVMEKGFPAAGEATVQDASNAAPTATTVFTRQPTAPVVHLESRRPQRWQRKVAAVAAGLTVTVGGVTGAAALGSLPDSVSRAVGSIYEALTPFDAPASLEPDSSPGRGDVTPDAGTRGDGTPQEAPGGPGPGQTSTQPAGTTPPGSSPLGDGPGGANPSPGSGGAGGPSSPATDPPLDFPLPVAPAPPVPGVPGQPTPVPPGVPAPPTLPGFPVPTPTTPSGLPLSTP